MPPDPERVVVVHYESESISDSLEDPRPTVVVLRDTATGAITRLFNDDEAALYRDLIDALKNRPWEPVVTWRMGSQDQFGWASLARRAAALRIALAQPTPHLDLARWLWEKYGNEYTQHGEHGRLFEIARLNNLPTRGWHAGTEDGPAGGTTAQRAHRCAVKTGAIYGVLRLELRGSLRTGAELQEASVAAPPGAESGPIESLVTLDQAAAVAGIHKRTLERMKERGELPEPQREGGGGRAALWHWHELRPAIAGVARAVLPEHFPRLLR